MGTEYGQGRSLVYIYTISPRLLGLLGLLKVLGLLGFSGFPIGLLGVLDIHTLTLKVI